MYAFTICSQHSSKTLPIEKLKHLTVFVDVEHTVIRKTLPIGELKLACDVE